VEFVQGAVPSLGYQINEFMLWPYAVPEVSLSSDTPQIPPGELTLSRGASVMATDGRVGLVEEFLVDPRSGNITHLVVHENRLWGQSDIVIPVSDIGRIEGDTVHLKISKKAVGALPAIPIRR
jgi:sporulation protein YlmC with PRC-barrel domain